MARKRIKTIVRIDRLGTDGRKKHFRSITLTAEPKKVWKALENGVYDVLDIDIEEIRAQRKRKGGKRGY